ncbi:mucin-5AC-like, partial [Drosophila miranda]|uniref:mucin-5AC-like n=1 Tax=Drosophila miranda TaxID=7229 RepID=UPI00143F87CD
RVKASSSTVVTVDVDVDVDVLPLATVGKLPGPSILKSSAKYSSIQQAVDENGRHRGQTQTSSSKKPLIVTDTEKKENNQKGEQNLASTTKVLSTGTMSSGRECITMSTFAVAGEKDSKKVNQPTLGAVGSVKASITSGGPPLGLKPMASTVASPTSPPGNVCAAVPQVRASPTAAIYSEGDGARNKTTSSVAVGAFSVSGRTQSTLGTPEIAKLKTTKATPAGIVSEDKPKAGPTINPSGTKPTASLTAAKPNTTASSTVNVSAASTTTVNAKINANAALNDQKTQAAGITVTTITQTAVCVANERADPSPISAKGMPISVISTTTTLASTAAASSKPQTVRAIPACSIPGATTPATFAAPKATVAATPTESNPAVKAPAKSTATKGLSSKPTAGATTATPKTAPPSSSVTAKLPAVSATDPRELSSVKQSDIALKTTCSPAASDIAPQAKNKVKTMKPGTARPMATSPTKSTVKPTKPVSTSPTKTIRGKSVTSPGTSANTGASVGTAGKTGASTSKTTSSGKAKANLSASTRK